MPEWLGGSAGPSGPQGEGSQMGVWVKVFMTPRKSLGLKFAPSRSATLFCAVIIVEIVVSGSKGFGCLLLSQLHLEQSQRRRLTGYTKLLSHLYCFMQSRPGKPPICRDLRSRSSIKDV